MAERIHAVQHGQSEVQCHARVADAELVSVGPDHVRGQHRRSAASQYQPERAEKLGDKSFHHLGIPREWPAGGSGGMLEIGRESCRERVCQYGSTSVVAVSLKKTKKNNNYHH